MNRFKFQTLATWTQKFPEARIYVLMDQSGKCFLWHLAEVAPLGNFALLKAYD